MGRSKKYDSPAARQAAYRARQRAAEGKPALRSPAELSAEAQRVRAGEVADIRASLIRRGARELADKLYPRAAGTTPYLIRNISAGRVWVPKISRLLLKSM